ncbi:MAG: HXXEE domain-containing protein [Bacteroidetes bacterium]|nr:HXXEE domain-containing protein [Bacteroidota bacterium]
MTKPIHTHDATVKGISLNQIAWLLPVTLLVHQLEEYIGEFPLWYSNLLNAQLSNQDFLVINGIGLFAFTVFAWSYFVNKNKLVLASLGVLVFVNGILHLLLSIFTFTYSPGTISGVVLFIPLGIIIFKRIMPSLRDQEKIIAIASGILVLFTVSLIAFNI